MRGLTNYLIESEAVTDSVDDTASACNISGEIFERSESGLSNLSIIYEMLPDSITVSQGTVQGVKGSGGDGTGGNVSLNNVHLNNIVGDGSTHLLVGFKGGVGGGEDGVGSRVQVNSSSGDGGSEFSEGVIFPEVGFFLTDGNSVTSPDVSGSLEAIQGGDGSSGSASRSGGSRGSSSRCGGGSGSSSGTLLQVFLEGRSGGDGFTGILVCHGIGVTGISHTSTSDVLVEGSAGVNLYY